MKKLLIPAAIIMLAACNSGTTNESNGTTTTTSSETTVVSGGQENVVDDVSQKDVVKVAASNPDFSTLVAAVKQADLVTTLSNAGPFTIFAPTNEAFNKLPAGTVDGLMKEDKKADLRDILEYHAYVGGLQAASLTDGQSINMVNGKNVTVSVKDGVIMLNNSAKIIASVPASNGIIHVIDNVLQEPK